MILSSDAKSLWLWWPVDTHFVPGYILVSGMRRCWVKTAPCCELKKGEQGAFQRPMSEVRTNKLIYGRARGNYTNDPRRKQICHIKVGSNAISICKTDLRRPGMLQLLTTRQQGSHFVATGNA